MDVPIQLDDVTFAVRGYPCGMVKDHTIQLDMLLLIQYNFSSTSLHPCRRPSEIQRPLVGMIPASVTTHTKPSSGTVCENIMNLTEVFRLLALLLGFGDNERDLILQTTDGAT